MSHGVLAGRAQLHSPRPNPHPSTRSPGTRRSAPAPRHPSPVNGQSNLSGGARSASQLQMMIGKRGEQGANGERVGMMGPAWRVQSLGSSAQHPVATVYVSSSSAGEGLGCSGPWGRRPCAFGVRE
eukprot:3362793-Rhodomonas_salina.1